MQCFEDVKNNFLKYVKNRHWKWSAGRTGIVKLGEGMWRSARWRKKIHGTHERAWVVFGSDDASHVDSFGWAYKDMWMTCCSAVILMQETCRGTHRKGTIGTRCGAREVVLRRIPWYCDERMKELITCMFSVPFDVASRGQTVEWPGMKVLVEHQSVGTWPNTEETPT